MFQPPTHGGVFVTGRENRPPKLENCTANICKIMSINNKNRDFNLMIRVFIFAHYEKYVHGHLL